MTTIEAGPYELTKQDKDFYEKITFCIMDDNSISKRVYNKYGNVTAQDKTLLSDMTAALNKLDSLISQTKQKNYVLEPAPTSAPNPVIGKRAKTQQKSPTKPQTAPKKDK